MYVLHAVAYVVAY